MNNIKKGPSGIKQITHKIRTSCFLIFLCFIGQASAGIGSRNEPKLLECSSCYTNYDFTQVAKDDIKLNRAHYYFVYNLSTRTIKTVFAVSVFEPEPPRQIYKTSNIVTTTATHLAEFKEYLDWIDSGKQEKTLEMNYPSTGVNSASSWAEFSASHVNLVMQTWVLRNHNVGTLGVMGYSLVEVTLSNGDVVVFAVAGYASATSFPLLYIKKENGDIIVIGTNGITISNVNGGAGSVGGYTDFSIPTGITFCLGVCVPRHGIVIIKRAN